MRDWDDLKPASAFTTKPEHPVFTTKSALYVRRILSTVMTEVEEEPYVSRLRVSSLPICGLVEAIGRIEQPRKPIPFSMAFYTAVGTAVHENLQNRMVRSKKYGHLCFGNWRCPECKKQVYAHQLRPKKLCCPICKKADLQYEELEFSYKGVSGHLDMLTCDKSKRFVAWEFKTTNESNVQNPLRYLPQLKHKMQIETYCMMLWRVHGIRVHTYTIVYISRNKTQMEEGEKEQFIPFTFRVTDKMMDVREAQLERIRRSDLAIKKLFRDPSRQNLQRLESLRPCRSRADYNDDTTGMKHAYFGKFKSGSFQKEECPFAAKGLCFTGKAHGTEAGMKIARLLDMPNKTGVPTKIEYTTPARLAKSTKRQT